MHPPPQINLLRPSEPASVTTLRHEAAAFAEEQGAGPALVADVNLAVSEAVTNAVKYASEAGRRNSVGLTAEAAAGWLEFRITDEGENFGRGSADGLGLGLAIIARLCDDLRIVQEGVGTTVLMRFALAR
ncbi:MAG: ATP-binding protein [Solirubrobacterales bacterium]